MVIERRVRELTSNTPILEKRPSSSMLRLKKLGDLAAMHTAVGIILTELMEARVDDDGSSRELASLLADSIKWSG